MAASPVFSRLRALGLAGAGITDASTSAIIKHWPDLEALELNETRVTELFFTTLQDQTQLFCLQSLELVPCKVTKEEFEKLAVTRPQTMMYLRTPEGVHRNNSSGHSTTILRKLAGSWD